MQPTFDIMFSDNSIHQNALKRFSNRGEIYYITNVGDDIFLSIKMLSLNSPTTLFVSREFYG